ncbi:helix-turn-helix domain-containing protein [Lentibacter sp. XHP0401]|uniref:helix-turn-helix domain-containing protein n=1 Tax=Lentibacter sp. XHP0401 TaxID=2984334 RepID=UPI0021E7C9F6|nr:helix-turn-helix transcriptional regulator [Lentibacter sp. XHP0401]MCV2893343.1 helix-turn-helix domain-containing protein [Lentibacter sp. XHP0401]
MAKLSSDSTKHLFDRIRTARERSDMSMDDAAKALGVSRVQIWRLEHKSETVSAERLFELADLYGVDPRKLLQGDDALPAHHAHYRRIAEIVAMVEQQAQALDVRPAPELVGEAVVEILQQEATQPTEVKSNPFDPSQYQGLITLLFKQAAHK